MLGRCSQNQWRISNKSSRLATCRDTFGGNANHTMIKFESTRMDSTMTDLNYCNCGYP
jgi:hypothetical protein